MSAINHRLFGNNNSTATHWYPSKGRDPIAISALTMNHVAAIIDLYESEAVKFLNENVRNAPIGMSEVLQRKLPITQKFLLKNVKAWDGLKRREKHCEYVSPTEYKHLFVDKQYMYNVPVPTKKEIIVDFKTEYPGFMNQDEIKPSGGFVIPTEKERIKAKIALRLTEMKLRAGDIDTATKRMKEIAMEIEKLMTQL